MRERERERFSGEIIPKIPEHVCVCVCVCTIYKYTYNM
jgi:hypothetical protein